MFNEFNEFLSELKRVWAKYGYAEGHDYEVDTLVIDEGIHMAAEVYFLKALTWDDEVLDLYADTVSFYGGSIYSIKNKKAIAEVGNGKITLVSCL